MTAVIPAGVETARDLVGPALAAPGRAGLVAGPAGSPGAVTGSGPAVRPVPAGGSAGTGATA